jgi:NAD(P)-dependent dehydrogenase (short-subunit alcohol dehydrogenase family)
VNPSPAAEAGPSGRRVLVLGDGEPADSVAAALAADIVIHSSPTISEIDDESVDRMLGDDEGVDIVVHALYPAECRLSKPLLELTEDEWRNRCDEPLEAAIRLARGSHRHLLAGKGTIVYLVPLMGAAGGSGFAPFVGAAEGVRVLARSLARSWGRDGIRSHSMTLDPSVFLAPEHAAAVAQASTIHPPALGRLPDVDEIVAAIEHISSSEFSGLTGTSLVMDGGAWMVG